MRLLLFFRQSLRARGHVDELIDEAAQIIADAEEHESRGLILDRFEGLQGLRVFVAEEFEVFARLFVVFVGHGCGWARACRSVMSRMTPERTTYRILRKFATSADGSPPTITRSASFPFSTVPTCLSRPMARDAVAVDATMTCIGVMPDACIASISA